VPPSATSTTAASERRAEYTVQVTAYDARQPADRLRARLAAKGWEARVVPAGTMWRVRVGRYATHAEAVAAAKRLEAEGSPTWVTEAEPR
jgi:rare lipoprotein A